MTRERIIELITKYLKQKDYRVISTGWVMTHCPFAQWTHVDGDDKRFSFGISVRGGFNCFTCGKKGSLFDFPKMLSKFTHEPYFEMEEFIKEYIWEEDICDSTSLEITYLQDEILDLYPYAPEVLSLKKKDIKKWNIRFDEATQSLLFPVYLNGKLNGIKVRNLRNKAFYTIGNIVIKKLGGWYGDWFMPRKWLALVEGERDAILLSRYLTAWASMGSPTVKQLETIMSLPFKILLFFDNDESGRNMEKKAIKYLGGIVPLYKPTDYFGCKDPAEIVEKRLLKKVLKTIKKIV